MKNNNKISTLVHSNCPVCGPRPNNQKPNSVLICDECMISDAVTMYCPKCNQRWVFDFQSGLFIMRHLLFIKDLPKRPGVAIRLPMCPSCVLELNPDFNTFEYKGEVYLLDHEQEAHRQDDQPGTIN